MGGGEWEASGVRAGGRLRAGRGRDELLTGRKESRREREKGVGDGREGGAWVHSWVIQHGRSGTASGWTEGGTAGWMEGGGKAGGAGRVGEGDRGSPLASAAAATGTDGVPRRTE